MKLLIIRHGDPDYAADSVTEKGAREVEMLAERLSRLDIHTFYVSPLGRAQRTAAPTLQRLHKDAVTLPWLREFQAPVQDPETDRLRNPWDFKPAYWMQDPRFYDASLWTQTPVMQTGDVASEAQRVYQGLDDVLARHGYRRKGLYYEATAANTDTIAFVCHFGVECVMLSHLMNISPMPLWHHFCALPSSVTTLVTEEREKGIAVFRCLSFGDLSHLYAHDEEPSFAARFCEVYDDFSQRH
ncbi:MAG TPA: histidine phosphatase family protein [Candidatus Faecimorpha stercoravium]|nr:histidine phosphatase family protein [Candidatus Faecimorpha stercoravium]